MSPGCASTLSRSAMVSSMARRVPEPMEKWAVVNRVADQDQVVHRPVLHGHRGEPTPERAVLHQSIPLQPRGEQLRAVRHRGVFVLHRQPRGRERIRGTLDDEGRDARFARWRPGHGGILVLVGVESPESGVVLLKVEGEGREGLGGAEPDEPVGAQVHGGQEVIGVPTANPAVDPIGRQDQVRICKGSQVIHLHLEAELHAQLPCSVLEDVEQRLPRHPGESVPRGLQHVAVVVDVDVVPVIEVAGDLLERLGIRRTQVLHGGVGEHHTEAERVVGSIPLHHENLVRGVGLLHEDGEVQARWPAADARDLQGVGPVGVVRASRRARAMISRWISVVPS